MSAFTASRRVPLLLATGAVVAACSTAPHPVTEPKTPAATQYGGGLAGETISSAAWERTEAKAEAATLLVRNRGCGFRATGSAVATSPQEAVTNRHVVEDAQSLTVETASGQTRIRE